MCGLVMLCSGHVNAAGISLAGFAMVTNEDNSQYLQDLFTLSGVAPWNAGQTSITFPGDSAPSNYWNSQYYVNYSPDFGTIYGPIMEPWMLPIGDGTYDYTFVDGAGSPLTDSPVSIVFTGTPMIPVASASCVPTDRSYTGTATPTLEWASADGSYWYRVVILSYYEDRIIWASDILAPGTESVGVPGGVLSASDAYRWLVEAYDAGSISAAQNISRSTPITLFTGTEATPLSVPFALARSRISEDREEVQLWVEVQGPAPWDAEVTIVGTGGEIDVTLDHTAYSDGGFYYGYRGQLGPQDFNFTVFDNRTGASPASQTVASTLNPDYALPLFDFITMKYVPDGAYIYTETPTFGWSEQVGVEQYRVQILSYTDINSFSRYDPQSVWTSAWTGGTSLTVPATGILRKDSAYLWRVEARDSIGNRSRGEFLEFFIADEQEPLAVSGEITGAGAIGFAPGNLMLVMATDSPQFPGGTEFSSLVMSPASLPAAYQLHNIPRNQDVYLHVFWDKDNNHSYSVGDYLGVTPLNYSGSDAVLTGFDIDIATEVVPAAAFGGTITCTDFAAGNGPILIEVGTEWGEYYLAGQGSIAAPGAYTIPTATIPLGGHVLVTAYWDTDSSGDITPTDQVVYSQTEVVTENTTVNLDIELRGFISGTVFDTDTTTPLADKFLTIASANDAPVFFRDHLFTDENGDYLLSVPAGQQYRVSVDPSYDINYNYVETDLLTVYFDAKLSYNAADLVNIDTSSPFASSNSSGAIPYVADLVDLSLVQGVYIRGTLRDESGDPLAGIPLTARDSNSSDIGRWGETDGNGEFALLVPPGDSYYVYACPQCSWWDGSAEPYVDRYYQDADPWANGATPNVAVGATDVYGIDMTLLGATYISGFVYEADGVTPIANLDVFASDAQTRDGAGGTWTRDDGSYTLVVPAGVYKVDACPSCQWPDPLPYVNQYYDSKPDFDAADEVDTTTGDKGGIDFELADARFISGHVYDIDRTTTIADVHVYAVDSTTGQWVAGMDTDQDGFYRFAVGAGTYKLLTCTTCGQQPQPYLDEIYDDAPDFGNATIVDTTGADQENIDFELEDGMFIEGTVTAQTGGAPFAGLHVYAEDSASGAWAAGNETRDDGTYTFVVPEGTYKVRACPSCNSNGGPFAYVDVYYDNAANFVQATEVTTGSPAATAVDFALSQIMMGDVNGDETVNLVDAVLGLKITTGSPVSGNVFSTGTVDTEDGIGLPEVLYILEETAAP